MAFAARKEGNIAAAHRYPPGTYHQAVWKIAHHPGAGIGAFTISKGSRPEPVAMLSSV
jgi:hypothetical protein